MFAYSSELVLTDALRNEALLDVERHLQNNGKSLKDLHSELMQSAPVSRQPRMIVEELA